MACGDAGGFQTAHATFDLSPQKHRDRTTRISHCVRVRPSDRGMGWRASHDWSRCGTRYDHSLEGLNLARHFCPRFLRCIHLPDALSLGEVSEHHTRRLKTHRFTVAASALAPQSICQFATDLAKQASTPRDKLSPARSSFVAPPDAQDDPEFRRKRETVVWLQRHRGHASL